eukprot:CAMPEP_0182814790 /NCGR_PEP_ID=MMETSP0006_2-20121128/10046_1 /TAXON_ID=97485 /ORGANISM="Prymnesium parvum, Strain Texoma1" /LENGTH=285 /DNA_ID=CAMNT_0024940947 /DNA_START=14 /DNA_END=871 /DNA_ORIENTATION=-
MSAVKAMANACCDGGCFEVQPTGRVMHVVSSTVYGYSEQQLGVGASILSVCYEEDKQPFLQTLQALIATAANSGAYSQSHADDGAAHPSPRALLDQRGGADEGHVDGHDHQRVRSRRRAHHPPHLSLRAAEHGGRRREGRLPSLPRGPGDGQSVAQTSGGIVRRRTLGRSPVTIRVLVSHWQRRARRRIAASAGWRSEHTGEKVWTGGKESACDDCMEALTQGTRVLGPGSRGTRVLHCDAHGSLPMRNNACGWFHAASARAVTAVASARNFTFAHFSCPTFGMR